MRHKLIAKLIQFFPQWQVMVPVLPVTFKDRRFLVSAQAAYPFCNGFGSASGQKRHRSSSANDVEFKFKIVPVRRPELPTHWSAIDQASIESNLISYLKPSFLTASTGVRVGHRDRSGLMSRRLGLRGPRCHNVSVVVASLSSTRTTTHPWTGEATRYVKRFVHLSKTPMKVNAYLMHTLRRTVSTRWTNLKLEATSHNDAAKHHNSVLDFESHQRCTPLPTVGCGSSIFGWA